MTVYDFVCCTMLSIERAIYPRRLGKLLKYCFRATDNLILQIQHYKTETPLEAGQSGIVIPATLLDKLTNSQRNAVEKMTFSVFKEPKLLSVRIAVHLGNIRHDFIFVNFRKFKSPVPEI